MKIEKINDNQIRCTLNRNDLISRQIKLSELAYGTEKAKSLFKDMIQQAADEFGFEADDIPLMIEAIPTSTDSIILIITKVEDPEELDTRFSNFSSAKEDNDFDQISKLEDEINGATALLRDVFAAATNKNGGKVSDTDETFTPLNKSIAPEKPAKAKASLNKDLLKNTPKDIEMLYSFDDMETVLGLSTVIKDICHGRSTLYKYPVDNRYYLLLRKDFSSAEDFSKMCNIISEYGFRSNISYAGSAFMKEHFEVILKDKAIQKLANI